MYPQSPAPAGNKPVRRCALLLVAALLSLVFAACTRAAPEGAHPQVSIHDPVMAREGDTYYLFSTGPGITIYRSKDRIHWHRAGRAFATEPSWAKSVAPEFNGHLWAPDVIERDGRYYLYYSVSAFGKNTSAIGVTTNNTLDPDSPDYQWRDQGIVIQSVPNRDNWNAIDPNIVLGDNGTAWMAFGSFWGGLKLVKLDDSWTKPAQPQEWHTIARAERPPFTPTAKPGPAELEGPFIFRKNGYYYLFISRGLCCRGDDSTYRLAVGRAKQVTGPYLDKQGKDLANGGGTPLIAGNKRWPGLGHNGAYTYDGKDYLVLHAYEHADHGLQKLKILDLKWDKDLWPVVDPAQLDTFKSQLLD
ncbi:arabinan endo-1,5-alpha-L-arabinosidase [Microbulbifer sp. SAOS-129_SWC]|uniref:arabinan endo-1,5-alpha-L-arabinosidase n=1 Tax=Microbulbifer sp. SAOS-129_SWC TaxID=3145235 RepID=UPI0032170577